MSPPRPVGAMLIVPTQNPLASEKRPSLQVCVEASHLLHSFCVLSKTPPKSTAYTGVEKGAS